MDENVFTGKTVDDAVDAGLKALGITLADAEIEILEEGKKKLFGSVKAKVKITVKQSEETITKAAKPETAPAPAAEPEEEEDDEPIFKAAASEEEPAKEAPETSEDTEETSEDTTAADAERAAKFIDGLLPLLRIEGEAKVLPENEDGSISITIDTATTYKVIGKRGDILDSIQCIAGAIANIGREKYKKVVVDCENYRATRKESLERLARKLEKKAVETGRKIILEPMNPYERRIIHSVLTDSPDVTTMSEGKEPNRYVVVIPSNAKPYDKGIRYGEHGNGHGGHPSGGRGNGGHGRYNGRGGKSSGGSRGNFNRDKQNSRPYSDRDNRDRGPRDNRDRDRGLRDNRDRDSRDNRDRRDNRGGSRPSGGAPRKKEIHFGAYLGNSNDVKKDD
ncbi:MAG: Jag N-terminal domain-containing protein [Clostridia bacterium]|nr:Jag N-terminal domain-containing protein [Clostridia bacterium]